VLIFAAILAILVYGTIAPLLGTLMPTFSLDDAQKGTIALANALGLVVASVSVGPLIDKRGKKASLLVGLVLVCVALFWLPNTGGAFGTIVTCMALLGLGGGIIVTGSNALASDVNEARRGSTLNLLNLFFGLGGLATPFVAGRLLGGDPVKLAYTLAILATFTLGVYIVTRVPKPSRKVELKAVGAGSLLRSPALYMLALLLFLYVATEVGVWNWLANYLTESRGLDKARALDIVSLGFALGMLIGRVVVSRILIKISAPTVTLAAAILMAITTFLMLYAGDSTMAWVAVFCAGMAMAPVFPTTLAIVADAFPQMPATAMGIVITCGWAGLAISSPIIGGVAKSSGLQTALLILPAFSAALIVVNLVLRPLLPKRSAA
jgi:fucose permease